MHNGKQRIRDTCAGYFSAILTSSSRIYQREKMSKKYGKKGNPKWIVAIKEVGEGQGLCRKSQFDV